MKLNETLLEKLANWRPPRENRQTLPIADEGSGWAVVIAADRHDELGTAVWEMLLSRRSSPTRQAGDLKNWADRVASQVTGLLEPLKVIEIDAQRDTAMLRSQEPTQRGGDLYYYEVLLTGIGQAAARRFHAQPHGGRREQLPFVLTHETLAKFATDLAAE